MYHIPDKLNLKKFKNVHIPRRKDLFRKYGEKVLDLGIIPDDALFNSQPNRKIETMMAVHDELYRKYAQEQAEKERNLLEKSNHNKDNEDS